MNIELFFCFTVLDADDLCQRWKENKFNVTINTFNLMSLNFLKVSYKKRYIINNATFNILPLCEEQKVHMDPESIPF